MSREAPTFSLAGQLSITYRVQHVYLSTSQFQIPPAFLDNVEIFLEINVVDVFTIDFSLRFGEGVVQCTILLYNVQCLVESASQSVRNGRKNLGVKFETLFFWGRYFRGWPKCTGTNTIL